MPGPKKQDPKNSQCNNLCLFVSTMTRPKRVKYSTDSPVLWRKLIGHKTILLDLLIVEICYTSFRGAVVNVINGMV